MKRLIAAGLMLAGSATQAQTVEYLHTDALGTPIAVTDANRVVIERSEYEPYGQLLNRPIEDEVGYTGHVQDAATGLTYMQQRYYDPQSGLFLSVDPVTAYGNPVSQFHRYRYANHNPYKFTDPDGREVVYRYGEGVTPESGLKYMISIMFSSTAKGEMTQLEDSSLTYTVLIDNTVEPGYNPNTRTLRLNPSLGIRIKSSGKIQSPKVNGGHEISHAAEHDRIGDKAFGEALKRPEDGSASKEEQRATRVEKEIGEDLGEPTRKDYNDAGEAVRCNPKAASGC